MIHGVFAFFSLSATEMLIVLGLAVLLFGKRLPEVARSLGKSLGDFQRGVQSIQQELQSSLREEAEASSSDSSREFSPAHPSPEDQEESLAPKFEPPPLAPPPEEVS